LSSLESGADIEQEQVSLPDLTARVLSQLDTFRAAKGHEITSHVETPTLCADPKRVEQVLFNLVENAIKYVPTGGHITVNWVPGAEGVELSVIDNGPGIAREHLGRVFERFYRVDSGRSREQGGTGLGLSIVKHIMQRHGGKVSAELGPEGRGTRFVCTFPHGLEP
jgi:two-component system phosphate regulon sensor histidine kinase PhoR